MFRELIRKKQELSLEECIDILKTQKRGVLSVNGDGGYPYGMPMDHWYSEEDGKIYFHCGRVGHRLDALKRDGRVSFCTYDEGTCPEGEWALNIKSVIVFGIIEIVDELEKVVEVTRRLCEKFTSDEEYVENEIARYASGTLLLVLSPEHICGKRVQES